MFFRVIPTTYIYDHAALCAFDTKINKKSKSKVVSCARVVFFNTPSITCMPTCRTFPFDSTFGRVAVIT